MARATSTSTVSLFLSVCVVNFGKLTDSSISSAACNWHHIAPSGSLPLLVTAAFYDAPFTAIIRTVISAELIFYALFGANIHWLVVSGSSLATLH